MFIALLAAPEPVPIRSCACPHHMGVVGWLRGPPELNGYITLRILVNLALASHQSIYPSSRRIEMLGGFNLSSCLRDPQE